MRAWQVTKHGTPTEALELVDVDPPVPGPGEVLVRAAASVCNYNEVDGCHGRYVTINPPLPYTLGMECVGEVVGAGPGAEQWLGRRVMASAAGATGAHADLVVCTTAMTFDAPPSMSDAEAASFFFPFHLAYLGLHARGRLQAGETVLVHAGAGGVGSAAVQLAVAAGARVIATASNAEKLQFVTDLGAEVAINYGTEDFAQRVLAETNGRGVDVCFDGVGGETMMASLRCLGRGGRHLMIGFASGIEAEEIPMVSGRVMCFGNFDILGVILSYHDDSHMPPWDPRQPVSPLRFNGPTAEVGRRVHSTLLEMFDAGTIQPIVGKSVPFGELPVALEEMEHRATIGRIVVER